MFWASGVILSKHSRGHFSGADSSRMQPKSGHQRSWLNSFLWHTEEQKKWNDDNGTHYFFTSEQEQNQMFHICSCLLDISMTMCRQCFNAAQLTAPERGWRPQHWAGLPMPDVPHVVETIQGGVLHLTNHTPCLFSVSLTMERWSAPHQTLWDDTRNSLTGLKSLHAPASQILLKPN